ncbi:RNA-dependent RNA polymerase [Botrytis cinerea flexivirus 1]|nr:RNA-dependent RNA polymerase [Botrytis cinerea flexivirus 1]
MQQISIPTPPQVVRSSALLVVTKLSNQIFTITDTTLRASPALLMVAMFAPPVLAGANCYQCAFGPYNPQGFQADQCKLGCITESPTCWQCAAGGRAEAPFPSAACAFGCVAPAFTPWWHYALYLALALLIGVVTWALAQPTTINVRGRGPFRRHRRAGPSLFALIMAWLIAPAEAAANCYKCALGTYSVKPFPPAACSLGCVTQAPLCFQCIGGPEQVRAFKSSACAIGCAVPNLPSSTGTYTVLFLITLAAIAYYMHVTNTRLPRAQLRAMARHPRTAAVFLTAMLTDAMPTVNAQDIATPPGPTLPPMVTTPMTLTGLALVIYLSYKLITKSKFPHAHYIGALICATSSTYALIHGLRNWSWTRHADTCLRCVLGPMNSSPFAASACTLGCAMRTSRCLKCVGGPMQTSHFPAQACILGCDQQVADWSNAGVITITVVLSTILVLAYLIWGAPRVTAAKLRAKQRVNLKLNAEGSGIKLTKTTPEPRPFAWVSNLLRLVIIWLFTSLVASIIVNAGSLLQYFPYRVAIVAVVAWLFIPGAAASQCYQCYGSLGPASIPFDSSACLVKCISHVARTAANECIQCYGELGHRSPIPFSACALGCVKAIPGVSCSRCTGNPFTSFETFPLHSCAMACAEPGRSNRDCIQCFGAEQAATPFDGSACWLGCVASVPKPTNWSLYLSACFVILLVMMITWLLILSPFIHDLKLWLNSSTDPSGASTPITLVDNETPARGMALSARLKGGLHRRRNKTSTARAEQPRASTSSTRSHKGDNILTRIIRWARFKSSKAGTPPVASAQDTSPSTPPPMAERAPTDYTGEIKSTMATYQEEHGANTVPSPTYYKQMANKMKGSREQPSTTRTSPEDVALPLSRPSSPDIPQYHPPTWEEKGKWLATSTPSRVRSPSRGPSPHDSDGFEPLEVWLDDFKDVDNDHTDQPAPLKEPQTEWPTIADAITSVNRTALAHQPQRNKATGVGDTLLHHAPSPREHRDASPQIERGDNSTARGRTGKSQPSPVTQSPDNPDTQRSKPRSRSHSAHNGTSMLEWLAGGKPNRNRRASSSKPAKRVPSLDARHGPTTGHVRSRTLTDLDQPRDNLSASPYSGHLPTYSETFELGSGPVDEAHTKLTTPGPSIDTKRPSSPANQEDSAVRKKRHRSISIVSHARKPSLTITKPTPELVQAGFSHELPNERIVRQLRDLSPQDQLKLLMSDDSRTSSSAGQQVEITRDGYENHNLSPHIFPDCHEPLPIFPDTLDIHQECWRSLPMMSDLLDSTPVACAPRGPACTSCIKRLYGLPSRGGQLEIPGAFLSTEVLDDKGQSNHIPGALHYEAGSQAATNLGGLPSGLYLGAAPASPRSVSSSDHSPGYTADTEYDSSSDDGAPPYNAAHCARHNRYHTGYRYCRHINDTLVPDRTSSRGEGWWPRAMSSIFPRARASPRRHVIAHPRTQVLSSRARLPTHTDTIPPPPVSVMAETQQAVMRQLIEVTTTLSTVVKSLSDAKLARESGGCQATRPESNYIKYSISELLAIRASAPTIAPTLRYRPGRHPMAAKRRVSFSANTRPAAQLVHTLTPPSSPTLHPNHGSSQAHRPVSILTVNSTRARAKANAPHLYTTCQDSFPESLLVTLSSANCWQSITGILDFLSVHPTVDLQVPTSGPLCYACLSKAQNESDRLLTGTITKLWDLDTDPNPLSSSVQLWHATTSHYLLLAQNSHGLVGGGAQSSPRHNREGPHQSRPPTPERQRDESASAPRRSSTRTRRRRGHSASTSLVTTTSCNDSRSIHIYSNCGESFPSSLINRHMGENCWSAIGNLDLALLSVGQFRPSADYPACLACINRLHQHTSIPMTGELQLTATYVFRHHGRNIRTNMYHISASDSELDFRQLTSGLVGSDLSKFLDKISGADQVENRDAAVMRSVLDALEKVKLQNPFHIPDAQFDILKKYGVQQNPMPVNTHPHPGNKCLENMSLYNDVPQLLNSLNEPYTAVSVSIPKISKLKKLAPKIAAINNPQLVVKDLFRYSGTIRTTTCTEIKTPLAFMHDVIHHLTPMDVHTMFARSPRMHTMLATGVIPIEATGCGPSMWPAMYQLLYDRVDKSLVTYVPADGDKGYHSAGAYTQPRSAALWLMHNRISSISQDLTIQVIEQRCAHVLICITRRSVMPPSRHIIPTPPVVLLPSLTTPEAHWSHNLVDADGYGRLVKWMMAVPLDQLERKGAQRQMFMSKATAIRAPETHYSDESDHRTVNLLLQIKTFLETPPAITTLTRLSSASWVSLLTRVIPIRGVLAEWLGVLTDKSEALHYQLAHPPLFAISVMLGPYHVNSMDFETTWITAGLRPASRRELIALGEAIILKQPKQSITRDNNPDPTPVEPVDVANVSAQGLSHIGGSLEISPVPAMDGEHMHHFTGRILIPKVELPYFTKVELDFLISHVGWWVLYVYFVIVLFKCLQQPHIISVPAYLSEVIGTILPIGPVLNMITPTWHRHAHIHTWTTPRDGIHVMGSNLPVMLAVALYSARIYLGPISWVLTGISMIGHASSGGDAPIPVLAQNLRSWLSAQLASSMPHLASFVMATYRPAAYPIANPNDPAVVRMLISMFAWVRSPCGPISAVTTTFPHLLRSLVHMSAYALGVVLSTPRLLIETARFILADIFEWPVYRLMTPLIWAAQMLELNTWIRLIIVEMLGPFILLYIYTDWSNLLARPFLLYAQATLINLKNRVTYHVMHWALRGGPIIFDVPGTPTPHDNTPLGLLSELMDVRGTKVDILVMPPILRQTVQRVLMLLTPALTHDAFIRRLTEQQFRDTYLVTGTVDKSQLIKPQVDPLSQALRGAPQMPGPILDWERTCVNLIAGSRVELLSTKDWLDSTLAKSVWPRSHLDASIMWDLAFLSEYWDWASNVAASIRDPNLIVFTDALVISGEDCTALQYVAAHGGRVTHQVITLGWANTMQNQLVTSHVARPDEEWTIPTSQAWGLIVIHLPNVDPITRAQVIRTALARASPETTVIVLQSTLNIPALSVLDELAEKRRWAPLGAHVGTRDDNDIPGGQLPQQLPSVSYSRPPWKLPSDNHITCAIRRGCFDPASWNHYPLVHCPAPIASYHLRRLSASIALAAADWAQALADPDGHLARMTSYLSDLPGAAPTLAYTNLSATIPVHGKSLPTQVQAGHPKMRRAWDPVLGGPLPADQRMLTDVNFYRDRINPAHLALPYPAPASARYPNTQLPRVQAAATLFHDDNFDHTATTNVAQFVHHYLHHGPDRPDYQWSQVITTRPALAPDGHTFMRRVLCGRPCKASYPISRTAPKMQLRTAANSGDRTLPEYPNWSEKGPILLTSPAQVVGLAPAPQKDATTCVLDTLDQLLSWNRDTIWAELLRVRVPGIPVIGSSITAAELKQFFINNDISCYVHHAIDAEWRESALFNPTGKHYIHVLLTRSTNAQVQYHFQPMSPTAKCDTVLAHIPECRVCTEAESYKVKIGPGPAVSAALQPLGGATRPFIPNLAHARLLAKEIEKKTVGVLGTPTYQPLPDLPHRKSMHIMKAKTTADMAAVPAHCILGVPGSAKTQRVLEFLTKTYPAVNRGDFLVVAPTETLRDSLLARFVELGKVTVDRVQSIKYAFVTFEVALRRLTACKTLYIDEVGLYPNGYIDLLLCCGPPPKHLVMTGDPTQRTYAPNPDKALLMSAEFRLLESCVQRSMSVAIIYIGHSYRLASGTGASLAITSKLNQRGQIFVTNKVRTLPTIIAEKDMRRMAAALTTQGTYIANSCQGLEVKGDYQINVNGAFAYFDAKTWFTVLSRGRANVYLYVADPKSLRPHDPSGRPWLQRVAAARPTLDGTPISFMELAQALIADNVPSRLRLALAPGASSAGPDIRHLADELLASHQNPLVVASNANTIRPGPADADPGQAAYPTYSRIGAYSNPTSGQMSTLPTRSEVLDDHHIKAGDTPANSGSNAFGAGAPGLFNWQGQDGWYGKIKSLWRTPLHPAYAPIMHRDPPTEHSIKPAALPDLLHPERIPLANPLLMQHRMLAAQVDPAFRELWSARRREYSDQFGLDTLPSEVTAFAHHKMSDKVTADMTYRRRLKYRKGYSYSMAKHRNAGTLLFMAFTQATGIKEAKFDAHLFEQCQRENAFTQLDKDGATLKARDARFDPDWNYETFKASVKGQWVKKLGKVNTQAGPGQTIACYRADYVLNLGAVGRYIAHKVKTMPNKKILVYSGLNERDLSARIRDDWDFSKTSEEDDYKAFDQSQDAAILEFELLLMRHIGIPEDLIEQYNHHKRCTKCQVGAKELDILRFSGEFGTFILNCTCNIAYTNLKYNIPPSAIQMYAGDDLVVNDRRTERPEWAAISKYYLLQSKPVITKRPTFCSMAITPAGLIRNPVDLAFRVMHAHRRGIMHKSGPALALDLTSILNRMPRYALALSDLELEATYISKVILAHHANYLPMIAAQMGSNATGDPDQAVTAYGQLPPHIAVLVNRHVQRIQASRAPLVTRSSWAHAPPGLLPDPIWSGVADGSTDDTTRATSGTLLMSWSGPPDSRQWGSFQNGPNGTPVLASAMHANRGEPFLMRKAITAHAHSTTPGVYTGTVLGLASGTVWCVWLTAPAAHGNTMHILIDSPDTIKDTTRTLRYDQ